MMEVKEKQKNFSKKNWEISTTIVGAQLLLDFNPGELNLEKVKKEIIQGVFFSNLIDAGQKRVDSGECDEEEIEVHKSIAAKTIIIQFMLNYTSIIYESPLELELIPKLDLPLDEKDIQEFVDSMTFSSEENKQLVTSLYSQYNSVAHEIMNNEDLMKVIVAVYKLLSSDLKMKKKHLLIHKALVELKFLNFIEA